MYDLGGQRGEVGGAENFLSKTGHSEAMKKRLTFWTPTKLRSFACQRYHKGNT